MGSLSFLPPLTTSLLQVTVRPSRWLTVTGLADDDNRFYLYFPGGLFCDPRKVLPYVEEKGRPQIPKGWSFRCPARSHLYFVPRVSPVGIL